MNNIKILVGLSFLIFLVPILSKTEPPLNIGGGPKFVSVTKGNSKIYREASRDSNVIGSADWMTSS